MTVEGKYLRSCSSILPIGFNQLGQFHSVCEHWRGVGYKITIDFM